MSELKIEGVLTRILNPESGTSKGGKEWSKQDFVIETKDQFPKTVCFTLFGDKTSLIAGAIEGSTLEVFFNIESREFNGKYFHNINAWKVNVIDAPVKQNPSGLPPSEMATHGQIGDGENDLPF